MIATELRHIEALLRGRMTRAEMILTGALKNVHGPMTRTEMSAMLGRHRQHREIEAALRELARIRNS